MSTLPGSPSIPRAAIVEDDNVLSTEWPGRRCNRHDVDVGGYAPQRVGIKRRFRARFRSSAEAIIVELHGYSEYEIRHQQRHLDGMICVVLSPNGPKGRA
jgi:hypothetical protein